MDRGDTGGSASQGHAPAHRRQRYTPANPIGWNGMRLMLLAGLPGASAARITLAEAAGSLEQVAFLNLQAGHEQAALNHRCIGIRALQLDLNPQRDHGFYPRADDAICAAEI